jgi:hypothetical protein
MTNPPSSAAFTAEELAARAEAEGAGEQIRQNEAALNKSSTPGG